MAGFGAAVGVGLLFVACGGEPGGAPSLVTENPVAPLDQPEQPGEKGCGPKIVCDDGNPCTTDSCVRGTGCVHTPADGAPCDDGNACTTVDTCSGTTCVGTAPVVCVAYDECHVAGVCDPGSGGCSNPAQPDGTAVPGGDCVGGVLVPQAPPAPSASGCEGDLSASCPAEVPIQTVASEPAWPKMSVPSCGAGTVYMDCWCTDLNGVQYICNFGRGPAPGTYTCFAYEWSTDGSTFWRTPSCSGAVVGQ
jgi:hypothetical protein